MNTSRVQMSKESTINQSKELLSRFPDLLGNSLRYSDYDLSDAIFGIDGKIDTVYGDTLNLQYKYRPDGNSDYAIPINILLLNNLKQYCPYYVDNDSITYFYLNLKKADYYISSRANFPPIILSTSTLNRILLRQKRFTSKYSKLFLKKDLDKDSSKVIDVSEAVLFIQPEYLAKLAFYDFFVTTYGKDFYEHIKNGDISLENYLIL